MAEHDAPLVLASASPRRRDLLEGAGVVIEIDPADVDETPEPDEPAAIYVERLARAKATVVAARHPGRVVVGADTVVAAGDELLGKPADDADAVGTLARLSGRWHRVLTGVAVVGPGGDGHVRSSVTVTRVRFRDLTAAEIEAYVATGEPADKAGSYAIQGGAADFVAEVDGPWDNVVGLPVDEVLALLSGRS